MPQYTVITYPDGGLMTSISDMTLYLREMIKGHAGEGNLLTNQSYEEISLLTPFRKVKPPAGNLAEYGVYWGVIFSSFKFFFAVM